MNFDESVKSGSRNYVNFSGRATRSEWWYWVLFVLLIIFGSDLLDSKVFPDLGILPLTTIVTIVIPLPSVAVSVRRLHDLDRN
jgi:uncharacterized membrane protein YhaH (DUF805 family)